MKLPTHLACALLVFLSGCCETPSHLQYDNWVPSITLDSLHLKKSTFISDRNMGDISDIVVVEGTGVTSRIRVTGREKSLLLDDQGVVYNEISFLDKAGHMVFMGDDFPGQIRFIDRGGGWQPVSAFNAQGVRLWEHGRTGAAPNSLAGGVMGTNQQPEFVVGYNGGGGLAILDQTGSVIRRCRGSNIWHVELLDTNADGLSEIVHSNAGGELVIRSSNLSVLDTIRTPYFIGDFTFCSWPVTNTTPSVLFRDRNVFVIMNLLGHILLTIPDPAGYSFSSDIKCSWIHFRRDEVPYLAIMEGIRATWHRSRLTIVSVDGRVVYQEILDDFLPAIAALPTLKNKSQTLLVGGDGVVWQYRLGAADE